MSRTAGSIAADTGSDARTPACYHPSAVKEQPKRPRAVRDLVRVRDMSAAQRRAWAWERRGLVAYHEASHAVIARAMGIEVDRITLRARGYSYVKQRERTSKRQSAVAQGETKLPRKRHR